MTQIEPSYNEGRNEKTNHNFLDSISPMVASSELSSNNPYTLIYLDRHTKYGGSLKISLPLIR